jgi:hypothetical protein
MYIGEDQKIYEAIRAILYPQMTEKIIKIKIEYKVQGLFTFTKIYGTSKNNKEKLLDIDKMNDINLKFEDNELIKIPLNLKKLREMMNSEKVQWEKCIYTLDKSNKMNVDFVYPGNK